MNSLRRIPAFVVAFLLVMFIITGALILSAGLPSNAHAATLGRSVSLSQAMTQPTYERVLKPGQSVSKTRQCGHGKYWSEFSAYRWDGSALAGQTYSHDALITWHDTRTGGVVVFDGLTFTNEHNTESVIVAGWCD